MKSYDTTLQSYFIKTRNDTGTRHLHALLKREGTRVFEKVVRRLMFECGPAVVMKTRRKYSAYQEKVYLLRIT